MLVLPEWGPGNLLPVLALLTECHTGRTLAVLPTGLLKKGCYHGTTDGRSGQVRYITRPKSESMRVESLGTVTGTVALSGSCQCLRGIDGPVSRARNPRWEPGMGMIPDDNCRSVPLRRP